MYRRECKSTRTATRESRKPKVSTGTFKLLFKLKETGHARLVSDQLLQRREPLLFSLGTLEQLRRETAEQIIRIKTDTEELDKDRRTREEKAKKERVNKIQNEVIQSHKKNVEIDWNWQELEEKEDCKELAEVSVLVDGSLGAHVKPPCVTLNALTDPSLNCRTLRLKKPHAPRSSRTSRS